MTGEVVLFWTVAPMVLAGAVGVVVATKAVYSALFLAMTMLQIALFYVAQGAAFLGVVQVVVYTGAVMMLFLFVLMLIGVDSSESLVETIRGQRIGAVIGGVALGVALIGAIGNTSSQHDSAPAGAQNNVEGLADLIFVRYLWAFELTSALLITAALGAMVLTHRERFERRKSQRELAVERFRGLGYPSTPTGPGVYARHNAFDMPALLPDGTPAYQSVFDGLACREVPPPPAAEVRPRRRRLPDLAGTNGHYRDGSR